MNNKLLLYMLCGVFISFTYSQTIEETLEQIALLKKEIVANELLVEEKIADMQRTNPLFAEKDIFESDREYLGRMAIAMPQFDIIRKQYLADLWQKMGLLRSRIFETDNIIVELDKNDYDANTETWPINIIHNDYQKENYTVVLSIKRDLASSIYKNWDKVQKIGILTIDIGDKIGLAKFQLKDPISGFEYTHEFRPMQKLHKSIKEGKPNHARASALFSPDGIFIGIPLGSELSFGCIFLSLKGASYGFNNTSFGIFNSTSFTNCLK